MARLSLASRASGLDRFLFLLAASTLMMPSLRFGIAGFTVLPEHLGVALLLLIVVRARYPRSPKDSPAFGAALLLILFWWAITFSVSALSAYDPGQSIRLLTWVALNIVFAILFFALRALATSMLNGLVVLYILGMIVNLVGWAQAQTSGTVNAFVEQDYASTIFRLNGLFDEPNLYAAFVTLLGCALYARRHDIRGLPYWMYMLVGTLSVYLTFTRVAWIMWAVLLAFVAFSAFRRSFAALGLIPIVGVLALLIADNTTTAASSQEPIVQATLRRMTSLFDTTQGTGYTRTLTVDSAFADLADRSAWLTGFGYNGYSQMHSTGVTSYAAPYLPNLWVALIYDGGVVAAAAFVIALVVLWWATRRRGTTLFLVSFALLAASTNNIWFAFPWALFILSATGSAHQKSRGDGDTPVKARDATLYRTASARRVSSQA